MILIFCYASFTLFSNSVFCHEHQKEGCNFLAGFGQGHKALKICWGGGKPMEFGCDEWCDPLSLLPLVDKTLNFYIHYNFLD